MDDEVGNGRLVRQVVDVVERVEVVVFVAEVDHDVLETMRDLRDVGELVARSITE